MEEVPENPELRRELAYLSEGDLAEMLRAANPRLHNHDGPDGPIASSSCPRDRPPPDGCPGGAGAVLRPWSRGCAGTGRCCGAGRKAA
jgi:hypothetical protein